MPGPIVPETDGSNCTAAIGSLIWRDPEQILKTAARLRGSNAVIECRLRGGSMGAAIPKNSLLRISLDKAGPYRVGDIVAFVQDTGLCVHRIVHKGIRQRLEDYIITQGDACLYPDPPMKTDRVLGPVTEFHYEGCWQRISVQPSEDRAQWLISKMLLALIAALMVVNIPIAQIAARVLRVRREQAKS